MNRARVQITQKNKKKQFQQNLEKQIYLFTEANIIIKS